MSWTIDPMEDDFLILEALAYEAHGDVNYHSLEPSAVLFEAATEAGNRIWVICHGTPTCHMDSSRHRWDGLSNANSKSSSRTRQYTRKLSIKPLLSTPIFLPRPFMFSLSSLLQVIYSIQKIQSKT